MINAANKTLGLHAYLCCIGYNVHVVIAGGFAADAIHWQVYTVPGVFPNHKLSKYFSAFEI